MNEPKPKRVKKQYDEEFRPNAVVLVQSSGRPLSEIAAELGISHWKLRDWIKGRASARGLGAGNAAGDGAAAARKPEALRAL